MPPSQVRRRFPLGTVGCTMELLRSSSCHRPDPDEYYCTQQFASECSWHRIPRLPASLVVLSQRVDRNGIGACLDAILRRSSNHALYNRNFGLLPQVDRVLKAVQVCTVQQVIDRFAGTPTGGQQVVPGCAHRTQSRLSHHLQIWYRCPGLISAGHAATAQPKGSEFQCTHCLSLIHI